MKYAEQKILLEYARLQLEIARSQNPTADAMGLAPENVHRSVGYKRLRAFTLSLRPVKRRQWLRQIQDQIDGVRQVIALAKATGETLSMADIEIIVRDKETGQAVPTAPTFAAAEDE